MKRLGLSGVVLLILLSNCDIQELDTPASDPHTTLISESRFQDAPILSNDSWLVHIEEHNGVPMALVPAGCFMMGIEMQEIAYLSGFASSSMELVDYADQMPVHEVCFEQPFWIDVHEVSQEQFDRFEGEAGIPSYFLGDDLPREQVTWHEAQSFCEQRDARLPTEAEWEYAARGPDGNLFSWGNTFNCRMGNFDDSDEDDVSVIEGAPDCDGFPATAPVGALMDGASWVGALNMVGNVWEWVADRYDSQFYQRQSSGSVNPLGPASGVFRVVRGGAWSINEVDHSSATFRGGIDPYTAVEHLGFRCAMSVE
jgi:formylglycine-generating enzyme required for sulfatase activity